MLRRGTKDNENVIARSGIPRYARNDNSFGDFRVSEGRENQIRLQCWWGRVLLLASALPLILSFSLNVSAQVFLKPQEAIEKLMPEAETHVADKRALTPELEKRLEDVLGRRMGEKGYIFIIGMKQGKPTAYAVILNEIGKERPITFMIVVNPDGRVRAVEVLVYRESQGSEIRDPRFMRQFEGKTVRSQLRAGHDIDVITGATLSSRSATYAVKKALALVDVFYEIRAP